ncbi:MAG: toxin-antitoxin system HicB family antitoxin [Limisphaerales bacterium]
MNALTIELPESLYRKVAELARADGISVEQFVATAAAEKMASLLTTDYLRREAALGSRADFERVLRKVPDVPPEGYDELPKV